MLNKIICLLVKLDLNIKIRKGDSLNEIYHNLIKKIGYIYSDAETDYFLDRL